MLRCGTKDWFTDLGYWWMSNFAHSGKLVAGQAGRYDLSVAIGVWQSTAGARCHASFDSNEEEV